MARILRKANLNRIIMGATFLGAGGGGSAEHGRALLNELENPEITLVSPEDMSSHEYAVMIAAIGAPRIIKERGFGSEALEAFKHVVALSKAGGRKIAYLMSGEMGGFNTLVPIYVAAKEDVPVVDADGNGRAVPELLTTLYSISEISLNPLVIANADGDIATFYLSDPTDHAKAEKLARVMATAWNMSAAFATWIVNKDNILTSLVPGCITKAEKIGEVFEKLQEKLGFVELTSKLRSLGAVELFIGTIESLEYQTVGGFDFGTTRIHGEDRYKNLEMLVFFKNENIIAQIGGNIIAMVPDIISLVDLEKLVPITNADTYEDQKVAVYGLKAPETWLKSSHGFERWKHVLKTMGYEGNYIALKS